jgi:hypothetical protein
MRIFSRGRTIIEYDPDDSFHQQGVLYIPSPDEQDRYFKKKSTRKVNAQNKPKNMYRWGVVHFSNLLPKGTRVYYSQYDAVSFKDNEILLDIVRDEHLLAHE